MTQLRVLLVASFTVALLAALMVACSSAPPPAPVAAPKPLDLSGNWLLTVESQFGSEDFQMTMQQTGNQLAGTVTGKPGNAPYTGAIDGTAVSFSFTIDVRGMQLKIDQVGVLEGDSLMKGKARIGQFVDGKFTARKKAP